MQRLMMRTGIGALILSFVLVALSACSTGGNNSTKDGSGSTSPSVSLVKPATGESQASSSSGGSATDSVTGAPSVVSSTTAAWGQKIIRNADIALQVTNVESMLATIRTITDSAGGVVFASSTSYSGDYQIASMTLDVPEEQFDQVINQLRSAQGVKKVEREAITSQDVTEQYVDLQSQLRNLQATQSRLQQLMSQATQLQDVLTIQQQLSNVEGQIEQTTGRINYLDKHTSFSRITVSLTPVGVPADTSTESGFDLGRAVHDAWEASLAFTGGVLTVLVKAAVFLWWFWPIVVVAGLLYLMRRQRRRHTNTGTEIVA